MLVDDADRIRVSPNRDEQRRHDEQRDRRGQREPADHRERQRLLHVAARADAERERQQPEQRAQRRHENRTQADARRFEQRRLERQPSFRIRCRVKSSRMMPFFTIRPTSRISPMNDDTLSGVPVIEQQPDRADERQRRGEQHHERLDERLELNHHHADHARRGEREHEQQRVERRLLARRLAADLDADSRRRRVRGEHGLRRRRDGAERAVPRDRRSSRSSAAGSRAAARSACRRAETSPARRAERGALVVGEKIGIERSSCGIEANRVRRANAHGDRAIVEPNLAGRHAEQRAARRVGDLRGREPGAIRLGLVDRHVHLGARLARRR